MYWKLQLFEAEVHESNIIQHRKKNDGLKQIERILIFNKLHKLHRVGKHAYRERYCMYDVSAHSTSPINHNMKVSCCTSQTTCSYSGLICL